MRNQVLEDCVHLQQLVYDWRDTARQYEKATALLISMAGLKILENPLLLSSTNFPIRRNGKCSKSNLLVQSMNQMVVKYTTSTKLLRT